MSASPFRPIATFVRSVRFRLAMLVTIALLVTAGVLVLGMNVALDTVAATIPEEEPTTLEGELLRILDMSIAELDGTSDAGTDALRRVEQAVQDQTLQQVRDLSLAALLLLVPVGLAIGWVVAGRVVRPVGTIAGVAREIEATDLSRRIRLGGPPDEMRDLADTFDAMLDRLDRGVRTQRRFVEDASHELRNPLAVIRTTLDVALAEPEDAEGLRSAAEVARRTADRMSTTVDELMALARTSAQPERRTSVDLAEVVAEVAQEYDAEAATRGVRLSRLAPSGLVVGGDRTALKRAQANLVSNALRVAPSGSVVHCRAGRAGGWLWFGVRDVGRGIAPDDQALVFRRAWRDGAPTAEGDGQGLGLALVRQIAEAHGGTVSVASVPGHGASFVVWLPDRIGHAKAVPMSRAPCDGRPALDGGRGLLTSISLGRAYPVANADVIGHFLASGITGRTGIGPTRIRPYRSGGPLPWTTPSPATIVSTAAGATCRRPHLSSGPPPHRSRPRRPASVHPRSPLSRGRGGPDAASSSVPPSWSRPSSSSAPGCSPPATRSVRSWPQPLVVPAGPDKGAALLPPSGEPLADMAERLLPSVVQIEADGAVGSGFVAADGGLILTASHVVGRSETVTLRLQDGTSVSGAVVAVDKSIDTAVIRADEGATDLKPLPLGALADVQVGEMTIAIGSPFGLSQTVTTGIVSALGRTVPTPMGELHDLIQTDAAINSGNSGGPLIDGEGRAIGINTAIASASGGSDGIGFAVPVDQAKQILDKVKDGTWKPEDNNPADSLDPLGGLFDQFLGPDGLDGLGDLFGLGPDGSQAPDSGGSDMADQMLRQLLDEFLRQLAPDAQARTAARAGSRAGRFDRPGR